LHYRINLSTFSQKYFIILTSLNTLVRVLIKTIVARGYKKYANLPAAKEAANL